MMVRLRLRRRPLFWREVLSSRCRVYQVLLGIACIAMFSVLKKGVDSWKQSTDGESNFVLIASETVDLEVKCQENMDDLLDLAERVHVVFNALRIGYFLTYRSLAAAVHLRNPFPWDNVLEVGVLSDTNSYSMNELRRAFALHRVSVGYDGRAGAYTLHKGTAFAICYEYYDFYKTGVVHRIGWESYYKWLTYRLKHSIAPIHIALPLASVEFGGLNLSVPHNAQDLLNQFYDEKRLGSIRERVDRWDRCKRQ